jgi:hypothetical protein
VQISPSHSQENLKGQMADGMAHFVADHAKIVGDTSRVLRPGDEFLLAAIAKDAWVNFAWGPVFLHRGVRGPARWEELLREAGSEIVEQILAGKK